MLLVEKYIKKLYKNIEITRPKKSPEAKLSLVLFSIKAFGAEIFK